MTEDDDDLSFEGVINEAKDCIRESGGKWEHAVNWARGLQGFYSERTVHRIIQIINLRFDPSPRCGDAGDTICCLIDAIKAAGPHIEALQRLSALVTTANEMPDDVTQQDFIGVERS